MTKGKAQINSSVSLAPPQPRSLRSRKRECPSDEILDKDDVQVSLHHQNTKGNNTAADATLPQCPQPMISTHQHEAAEQACVTKQDPDTEEKHAEATNVHLKNVKVKAPEEQEETTLTSPNNDSALEGFTVHGDNDADKSGKDEEVTAEECSTSQTCTDQLQVFLPIFEDGDGTGLVEHLGAKDNSQCKSLNLERSQEEPGNVNMADVNEVTKEAPAGLPAKKKRRMGMCGLTERERSHFLQTQKRENGQNGPERAEKQICNNTADLVAQGEIIPSPPLSSSQPIPAGSVTEQNEAEIKHQSSHCEEDRREETEVHIAVTTSDGSSAVCDPSCSKGKACEVKGVPGPEQTGDLKSDPLAEEGLLRNQEQQELQEHKAEQPQEQIKEGGDGSAVEDQSPAITFNSNPAENEFAENTDAVEAALLQVNSVTRTREETKLTADAGEGDGAEAGASPTDSESGGVSPVEPCEAAVTVSGLELKDSCACDDEPGAGPPPTVNAEPPQTTTTTDPFGCGYLDYVSDSQLNTIILTEEEVMEREEDHDSPDCHEDASDLICGLVRELSSLNRMVMATHRELENLRRSSKSSRTAIR